MGVHLPQVQNPGIELMNPTFSAKSIWGSALFAVALAGCSSPDGFPAGPGGPEAACEYFAQKRGHNVAEVRQGRSEVSPRAHTFVRVRAGGQETLAECIVELQNGRWWLVEFWGPL